MTSLLVIGKTLIRPWIVSSREHIRRLINEPPYRRFAWLQLKLMHQPRHTSVALTTDGLDLLLVDAASFLSAYRDIFVDRVYDFPCGRNAPLIVDLGANIGLATIWLKRRHPKARLIALEPDPAIYSVLEENIRANGFAEVELLNKAAWNADTTLLFEPDGADGGRQANIESGNAITVEAVAIDHLLQDCMDGDSIDFLKIDVEGAEDIILEAIRPLLPRVRSLFVEYHGRKGLPSTLGRIIRLIEEAGFEIDLQSLAPATHGFQAIENPGPFHTQLNLFAWRRHK